MHVSELTPVAKVLCTLCMWVYNNRRKLGWYIQSGKAYNVHVHVTDNLSQITDAELCWCLYTYMYMYTVRTWYTAPPPDFLLANDTLLSRSWAMLDSIHGFWWRPTTTCTINKQSSGEVEIFCREEGRERERDFLHMVHFAKGIIFFYMPNRHC